MEDFELKKNQTNTPGYPPSGYTQNPDRPSCQNRPNPRRNQQNRCPQKRSRRRKPGSCLVPVFLFLLLAVVLFFAGKTVLERISNNQSKTSSGQSGSVSNGNSTASGSAVSFWGDRIDFTTEIQPLNGEKSLQKWPSTDGFSTEPANIAKYKGKEYEAGCLNGITIILDPGHGGEDLGAVYPRAPIAPEIMESRVNAAIANCLKDELTRLGATVVLTREEDKFFKLYYRSAVAAKTTLTRFYDRLGNDSQNRELISGYLAKMEETITSNSDTDSEGWFYGLGVRREIKNIMDLQKADTDFLFLSLHCNSSETAGTLHGTKVYYATNEAIYNDEATLTKDRIFPEYQNYRDSDREKFAKLLYNNIIQDSPAMVPNKTDKPIEARNYSVIREQNLVSALIEMGYVNDKNDRNLLLSDTGQSQIAKSIAKAVYQYFCK